jgi:hypothetical protein
MPEASHRGLRRRQQKPAYKTRYTNVPARLRSAQGCVTGTAVISGTNIQVLDRCNMEPWLGHGSRNPKVEDFLLATDDHHVQPDENQYGKRI